jgi:hypothetical protein
MKDIQKYLTVLAVSSVLVIFFLLTKVIYLVYISVAISVLSVLFEKFAEGFSCIWLKITKVIAFVINNTLLSIVFFLFLTPISWLKKVFHSKNKISDKDSFFTNRNYLYRSDDLKKTW